MTGTNKDHPAIESVRVLHRRREDSGTTLPGGNFSAISSELHELRFALSQGDIGTARQEFGDLLCNVLIGGMQVGIEDPLECLQAAVRKVHRRVDYIETHLKRKQGKEGYDFEVMELWEQAKVKERGNSTQTTSKSV